MAGCGSAMVDDLHGMEKTMASQHYALSAAELRDKAEKIGTMAATDKPEADAMDRVAIALYEVGAVLAERLEDIADIIKADRSH